MCYYDHDELRHRGHSNTVTQPVEMYQWQMNLTFIKVVERSRFRYVQAQRLLSEVWEKIVVFMSSVVMVTIIELGINLIKGFKRETIRSTLCESPVFC